MIKKKTYQEVEKELEVLKGKVKLLDENFFEGILNCFDDPFFIKDDKSRLLLVNDAFCEIFGLSKELIIGKTLAEKVPENEMEHFLRIDREVINSGNTDTTEESLTIKGEKTRTISTTKSRIIDGDGQRFLLGRIKDISHLKEASDNRTLIQTTLENLPVIFYNIDKEGIFRSSVGKRLSGLGLQPNEVVGSSVFDIYKDYPEIIDGIKDCLHGKSVQFETTVNGSSYLNIVNPGTSSEEGVENVVGVAVDITENKKLQDQFLKTNLLLEETSKIGQIGGWEVDLITMEGHLSTEACRIYGIPPTEKLKVEEGINFYAPEARPIIQNAVKKAIEEGTPYDIELPLITRQGKRICIRTKGKVQFENGKAIRLYGIIQDITESRKAINETKKLSTAIEQSPSSIVITDLKGRIEYTNPHFTKVTGYSAEDVLGKNPRILGSGFQTKEFYAEMWATILAGKVWTGEFQNRTKNGDVFWEEASITPVKNEAGEMINFLAIKKDITDLKEATKKLKKRNRELQELGEELTQKNRLLLESKNKYETLFEKSPVSIFEQDFSKVIALLNKKKAQTNDIIKYINEHPSFAEKCRSKMKILNVNEKTLSLIGAKNITELIRHFRSPNSRKSFTGFKEELISIASGDKVFYGETEYTRTDGRIIQVILKSAMTYPEGKNITSIVNITERKKNEEALEKLNIALEKSTNEIYIFDADSLKFSFTNYGANNNIGYTLDELQSMSPVDIKPEYSLERFNRALAPLKKGEIEKLQFETIHERKNKTTYPVEVNLSKFEINNKTHFLALVLDITKRKEEEIALIQAKERAEQSEKELKRTQELTSVGSWYLDLATNKVTWTEEMYKMFGLDPLNEAPPFHEQQRFFSRKSWRNLLTSHKKTMDSGVLEEFELETVKEDGTHGWILINGEVVHDEEFNTIGLRGAAQDITQRKIEGLELIKAKEKAEESDKLKSEFFNNLSHEIRTPMNGILGFSEMLSNNSLSEQKRNNFIKIIQSSGKQLLHIIDDILEISQLETRQVKVVESEVCLNDFLMELFSIFESKAKKGGISFYLKKQLSDKQSTIFTDKLKLNKILGNLLENALKYTIEGSVDFGYSLKGDEIEIYIKDTGVGVDRKNHTVIFERFSQEEKEISKKTGGLGLGLSIAKENTELLGGTIRLESEKGKGATFFISIPYKPVYPTIDLGYGEGREDQQQTILIAEDEGVNFMFLKALIEDVIGLECKTIHATNGKEAIEFINKNAAIDLVFMDLKMPVMNGFEGTRQIKKIRPDLPVIAQTAYTTSKEREGAVQAGCDEIITKPIVEKAIRKIIDKYLVKEVIE